MGIEDGDLRFFTVTMCEWCGIRPATEEHHCIVNRDKHNKALDDEHNIGNVCRRCHSQWVGTGGRETKEAWWSIQSAKFPDMREWYAGLKLKSKELF